VNLVAKEGALVNATEGVIVLSENAGAHEELRGHVLSINPFDVEATAQALSMPDHGAGGPSSPERRRA